MCLTLLTFISFFIFTDVHSCRLGCLTLTPRPMTNPRVFPRTRISSFHQSSWTILSVSIYIYPYIFFSDSSDGDDGLGGGGGGLGVATTKRNSRCANFHEGPSENVPHFFLF